MIKLFKKNRTFRLRAIRAYLLIILIGTFLLFCFNVISIYEQSITGKELEVVSASNLRLLGKELVLKVEHQLEVLASQCLSRQNMQRLAAIRGKEDTLEKLRAYRTYFEGLKKEYPVAESFFILNRDDLVFPLISSPPPQDLTAIVAGGQAPDLKQFNQLFSQGKYREFDLNQPAQAVESYQLAEKLDVGTRLKALALFRAARSIQKADKETEAVEAYRALIEWYGDQYDESGIPYALSLAVSPEDLTRKAFVLARQSMQNVYQNLVNGRWELSAEQVEQYLNRMEKHLGLNAADRPGSDFLSGFQLAKAIKNNPPTPSYSNSFEVARQSFQYIGASYQTYTVLVPFADGEDFIVGFCVSLPWMEEFLLPALLEEPRFDVVESASLVKASSNKPALDNEAVVQFSSILPSLNLYLLPESMRSPEVAAKKEIWYVGLAAVMLLCVMGVGLKLLIHVSWDIRWFQLRSDFVSGVSHEFKTPLSLIRLYSETLATPNQEFSAEDRNNYLRIIARESERMSRLVDNVLSFTKIEQERFRYEMQEGDIAATVTQTVNDYSEYLTWRGFQVKCSILPQLPPVHFNPEQVSEMVLNLMDNARKYSGKSRQIRVNVWAQDKEVIVEVRDYGIGIPSVEREKIFQPFYRVAKRNEQGGCGLGLYLVDQVMKQHGGRVEVESQVNYGSRFHLVFPPSGSRQVKFWKKSTHELTEAHFERQLQI